MRCPYEKCRLAMQNRREELERRRRDLEERRKEHYARRKALDERRRLYQQEVQLDEEERLLAEEEERLLLEHERLDYLESGLDYEESNVGDAAQVEPTESLPIHAFLIGIGILVILFAVFSWFSALGNMFGIAGFVCLIVAVWKAFSDEERNFESLRLFLGGIAFFWGGALLVAICGTISGIYFSGFFSFLNFLGLLGNGILIVFGLSVCIFGFVKAFSHGEQDEVSDE